MKDFKINLKKAILDMDDFKDHALESDMKNATTGGTVPFARVTRVFRLMPY